MLSRVSLRVWTGRAALAAAGATGLVYAYSPGMRRSVSFWSTVAPFVVEFEAIKARATAGKSVLRLGKARACKKTT